MESFKDDLRPVARRMRLATPKVTVFGFKRGEVGGSSCGVSLDLGGLDGANSTVFLTLREA